MRLINADALLQQIAEDSRGNEGWYGDTWGFINTIKDAPTVDAVRVGRCKDCDQYEEIEGLGGWCNAFMHKTVPNHYCSYGERRTDETD